MSYDENCTFTVVRTSDATKREITLSLATKLSDLKETLADEFLVSTTQRIFYMGRELKSNGKSLSKLGLGKLPINVLHLHVPPSSTTSSHVAGTVPSSKVSTGTNDLDNYSTIGVKRRRKESQSTTLHDDDRPSQQQRRRASESIRSSSTTARNSSSGIIEILDDSDDDDDVQFLPA